MTTPTKIIIGCLIALVALAPLARMRHFEPTPRVERPPVEVKKPTVYDAYGMSCQLLKTGLQLTDDVQFHISQSDCIDNGDGSFVIVGSVQGKRWVTEIQTVDGGAHWSLVRPAIYDNKVLN